MVDAVGVRSGSDTADVAGMDNIVLFVASVAIGCIGLVFLGKGSLRTIAVVGA